MAEGSQMEGSQRYARRIQQIEGWLELGRPDRALELIPPLLANQATRIGGLCHRVEALVELGRFSQALADLEELRPVAPDPDWFDLREAWCLKRVDKIEAAVACMRRLVARCRRSAIGWYNLGCYLALLGNRHEAIDTITMACGLDTSFRKLAATETDLDSLRDDPSFAALIE